MSFLIDDFNLSNDVKNSILRGSNYLSHDKTRIGNRLPLAMDFKTLDSEWINVSDWRKVCQNRICEPVPNSITINSENSMFLMGGWLHGILEDTTVPEFDSNNYDNLLSDIMGSSIMCLVNGDMSSAYMYLQTWLFFMSSFESEHIMKTSFATEEKLIIPFTL